MKMLLIALWAIGAAAISLPSTSETMSQTPIPTHTPLPPPFDRVTLSGGGKTYGGVFVGGVSLKKDGNQWVRDPAGEAIIEDNLTAYTNRLNSLSGSGWTEDRMSVIPPSVASLAAIKAAIDRFKPGGATPLAAGDEFQFEYVGHGPVPMFADGPDPDQVWDELPASTLAEWLSGFPWSVTIAVIFNSCGSYGDAYGLLKAGVRDNEGNLLDSNHLGIAWAAKGPTNNLRPSQWWWFFGSSFQEELTEGVENAMETQGMATMKDVIKNYLAPTVKEKLTGNNDADGSLDEDGGSTSCGPEPGGQAVDYDDDGDGQKDEDPPPQEAGYMEEVVGGIAELPDVAGGSGSPVGTYAAIAGGLAAAVVALMAGAWYARRRWVRCLTGGLAAKR